jgi:hypothetical protein
MAVVSFPFVDCYSSACVTVYLELAMVPMWLMLMRVPESLRKSDVADEL